ncbi:MAG: GNAT family N-acetyltransferase [Pleurocapsa minor GSE-CHR-MK-17-07R]|jgi:RimJ/RimL family protein N-acetyltransferase|nr:GNAT family N-acetyltransferase [Pleurocapsa minor GSE-CHR-MK 17-07R]
MPPFITHELLRGEYVYLARPVPADAERITKWSFDMEFSRMLRRSMVYPGSISDTMKWFVNNEDESFYPFSIRTLVDDELIGTLGIKDVLWPNRTCSFFIGIGEADYRGRGLGKEAIQIMLRWIFLEMNLNRVGLEVMAYNEAAIRSYRRVGFQDEGRLRQFVYRDGVYYDVLLMSMMAAEWFALHPEYRR